MKIFVYLCKWYNTYYVNTKEPLTTSSSVLLLASTRCLIKGAGLRVSIFDVSAGQFWPKTNDSLYLKWYYDQKIVSFFSSDFESAFA